MISYLPDEERTTEGVRHLNFYSTNKWRKVRDQIKLRDKMTCCICHQPITGRYIVDHIKPLTTENMYDWDIAYNPKNLQLLCISCHNRKTFTKAWGAINTTFW